MQLLPRSVMINYNTVQLYRSENHALIKENTEFGTMHVIAFHVTIISEFRRISDLLLDALERHQKDIRQRQSSKFSSRIPENRSYTRRVDS